MPTTTKSIIVSASTDKDRDDESFSSSSSSSSSQLQRHQSSATTTTSAAATTAFHLDEQRTAISYYVLYSSKINDNNDTSRNQNHKEDEDNDINDDEKEDKGEQTGSNILWEEDEWTQQDMLDAERTLREAQERCNYVCQQQRRRHSSSKPKTSSSVPDDDYDNDSDEQQYWNDFYKHHETNFFKDRHYLQHAFPNEMNMTTTTTTHSTSSSSTTTTAPQGQQQEQLRSEEEAITTVGSSRTLVEIGCGVGNALLPLLEEEQQQQQQQQQECYWATVWGLDFSEVAIDLLKKDVRFIQYQQAGRAHAHVWDISKPMDVNDNNNENNKTQSSPSLPRPSLPWLGVANLSTLLFCLSALDPKDMSVAAINVAATLQPGGTLLLRDYGRYDEAQLKLGTSRGKRLGDNYYRKHDGTTVYYFTLTDLQRLFVTDAGLQCLELTYIRRVYYNRKTQERRRRVWAQGRFRKPESQWWRRLFTRLD